MTAESAAKAAVAAARTQNTRQVNPEVAEMQGPEAPPRKNGELVFDALWEGRTFGMAVTLSDKGLYPWRDFRSSLIEVVSKCDETGDTTTPYYERFLAALEHLAVDRGLVSLDELDALTAEYAAKRAAQDAARLAADAAEAAEAIVAAEEAATTTEAPVTRTGGGESHATTRPEAERTGSDG